MRDSVQPRPRRRFRRAPDEKRARIIAVARACFSERSYEEVTTAEIARRAEVSEGTIFHHFGTKLHLLQQVAEQWAADLGAAMFEGAAEEFRLLPEALERAHAFVKEEGVLGLDPGRRGNPQPMLIVAGAVREVVIDWGARMMEAWNAQGVVRPMEDPRLVAEVLFPIVNSLLVKVFKHGRERISPEYLEEASRCILGAVDFKPPEA
jgi:AcrR family transcriptional regulator